jgi:hypothetical protein
MPIEIARRTRRQTVDDVAGTARGGQEGVAKRWLTGSVRQGRGSIAHPAELVPASVEPITRPSARGVTPQRGPGRKAVRAAPAS